MINIPATITVQPPPHPSASATSHHQSDIILPQMLGIPHVPMNIVNNNLTPQIFPPSTAYLQSTPPSCINHSFYPGHHLHHQLYPQLPVVLPPSTTTTVNLINSSKSSSDINEVESIEFIKRNDLALSKSRRRSSSRNRNYHDHKDERFRSSSRGRSSSNRRRSRSRSRSRNRDRVKMRSLSRDRSRRRRSRSGGGREPRSPNRKLYSQNKSSRDVDSRRRTSRDEPPPPPRGRPNWNHDKSRELVKQGGRSSIDTVVVRPTVRVRSPIRARSPGRQIRNSSSKLLKSPERRKVSPPQQQQQQQRQQKSPTRTGSINNNGGGGGSRLSGRRSDPSPHGTKSNIPNRVVLPNSESSSSKANFSRLPVKQQHSNRSGYSDRPGGGSNHSYAGRGGDVKKLIHKDMRLSSSNNMVSSSNSSSSATYNKAGGKTHNSNIFPRVSNTKHPQKLNNKNNSNNQDVERLGGTRTLEDHRRNDMAMNNSTNLTITTKDTDKVSSNEEEEESESDEAVDPWVRSAPAELYYTSGENGEMTATDRTKNICGKFQRNLVQKAMAKRIEAENVGATRMAELIEAEKKEIQLKKIHKHQHKKKDCSSSSDDSDSGSDDSDPEEVASRSDTSNRELQRRKKHPRRLHEELWHNDPGQMNDGPVCRCSAKARRFGIRHGFYPGEESDIHKCAPYTNNSSKLYHYKIIISPRTNLLIKSPTVISHDGHDYIFEGFSIFSHYKLDLNLPPCRVIRFNIRYCMCVAEEVFPQTFCIKELKLFEKYIFNEILELVDLKIDYSDDGSCNQFHLMPRFVRKLPDNGKEILSMNRVLEHLLKSDKELIKENELPKLLSIDQSSWQNLADKHKGTIVAKWGMKPCAIRVDQIDRDVSGHETEQEDDGIPFPLIVHFGIRPPQLSYAGNVEYQRAWRRFVKYRHLLSNMPKPKIEDKRKLLEKDLKLQEMRTRSTMKRDVTVAVSAKGFRTTGICCDLVQHAMLIPVLFAHLRFHKGLEELETRMQYKFNNRYLLQLAMTHPSYRENFGTNPDHARNALTNCGIRQPEYGDRKIHYASSRKRGINTLIDIMARFGMKIETESDITHNERLEFLGDAVVEFVTSIHLFHIFPDLEEGGLATYRAAIVQNQHLAVLAQNLGLDQFMLYAHGSDLCHDSELRHAMANCFEALMGALFLDGGIEVWTQIKVADRVFSSTMYGNENEVLEVWVRYPRHPLQVQEPNGDRHWIESHKALQKITEFEDITGIQFNHIRLLARAFTDRSLGYNNLSRGSNQRLEFLGDTVLQLIASEYLYRFFPDHHEGHLSLLRSSLVNNRTQAVVCDTLGMAQYAMRNDPKSDMKTKDRADLLEAFLGALYIDQGLQSCVVFCSVCFFPRLEVSIVNQDWNDPKSKLQQCCLTLRSMDGKEPEIPTYKVTEVIGATNTRVYKVAVYFKNKRLATSRGHSIQEAEMNAASYALVRRSYLFPQLKHQKRLLQKSRLKTK